jgi:hypothetical protein
LTSCPGGRNILRCSMWLKRGISTHTMNHIMVPLKAYAMTIVPLKNYVARYKTRAAYLYRFRIECTVHISYTQFQIQVFWYTKFSENFVSNIWKCKIHFKTPNCTPKCVLVLLNLEVLSCSAKQWSDSCGIVVLVCPISLLFSQ